MASGWWILLGATFVALGLVLWCLAAGTADGRIGKNSYAGIRLPSTMHSEDAWVAGHQAARGGTQVGAAIMVITGGSVVVTARTDDLATLAVFVGTPLFCGAFLKAVRAANKAANKCR
ncbi:SdpI family protein [bacterium]|nr:SdpI family protein [bacterium]